jgi:hypothetical protein
LCDQLVAREDHVDVEILHQVAEPGEDFRFDVERNERKGLRHRFAHPQGFGRRRK